MALTGFFLAASAYAQSPPPPQPVGPQADEIRGCLCLKRAVDSDSAALGAKQQTLAEARQELARADAELERTRGSLDVNDPAQVARFRQLLAQRDTLFRRANGDVVAEVTAAVRRYNDRVADYNARCTDRPFDSVLMSQIQASPFACPIGQ